MYKEEQETKFILTKKKKYRISVPEPSLKHFQSIARRLYRIFAHAYFHHREIYEYFEVSHLRIGLCFIYIKKMLWICYVMLLYWSFSFTKVTLFIQNDTSLYARFLLLSQTYNLIPPSLVSIPNQSVDADENEQEDNEYDRNIQSSNSSAIFLPTSTE